jgi:predicted CXXCH cytochrome family protein
MSWNRRMATVVMSGILVGGVAAALGAQSGRLTALGVPAHTVGRPCEYCHQMASETSHPTGMKPSMIIPSDLPLDIEGRVGCVTCHDVTPATRPGQSVGTKSFLRRSAQGGSLCAACHTDKRDPEARKSHALMIGSAHGGADVGGFGLSTTAGNLADSRSMQCMGCHDGSIASADSMGAAGVTGTPWSGAQGGGSTLGRTHPIGADYAVTAASRREFTPAGDLQRGVVRLVEGKVGCTSCHSPFSKRDKLLVMNNNGSQLCLRCHHL